MKLARAVLLSCVLLAFPLTAAAGLRDKLKTDPEAAAKIHTVGIISAAGREVIFQNVGLMVFGNKRTDLKLSWSIDDYLVGKATELLRAKYEIIPVAYDPNDFFEADPSESTRRGEKRPPVWLSRLPVGKVDAYLVFNRDFEEDFVGRTNQTIAGFGIYKGLQAEAAYARYRMFVVDGTTHEILEKWIGLGMSREMGGGKYDQPMIRREKGHRGFDGFKYPKKPEQMTEEHYKRFEAEIKMIIDQGLPKSFAILGLVDKPN